MTSSRAQKPITIPRRRDQHQANGAELVAAGFACATHFPLPAGCIVWITDVELSLPHLIQAGIPSILSCDNTTCLGKPWMPTQMACYSYATRPLSLFISPIPQVEHGLLVCNRIGRDGACCISSKYGLACQSICGAVLSSSVCWGELQPPWGSANITCQPCKIIAAP